MPGRQYIAKANQVQPARLIKDVEFLSEGILSFVEHAPRLLIVQPSRLLPNLHSKQVAVLIIAIYAPEITTLILQITTLITKNSTLIMHRRKRLGGMGNLS